MISRYTKSAQFFIFNIILTSLITEICTHECHSDEYRCRNFKCIKRSDYCNTKDDCGDGSDELHCSLKPNCPDETFFWCPDNAGKCIPESWECDQVSDCNSTADETDCVKKALSKATGWIKHESKKANALSARLVLPRIAVSLYLASPEFFLPGNTTGEHISKELTIQLLSILLRDRAEAVSTNVLAQYLHGLIVSCVNPRHFYGRDLVSIIRQRVDNHENYTNPFVLLALCNAGDEMTIRDYEKLTNFIQDSDKSSWTDIQALALMALTCIRDQNPNLKIGKELIELATNMKGLIGENGSVDCLHTTGFVAQALSELEQNEIGDSITNATNYIRKCQQKDGSFNNLMNTYAVLPVLSSTSLRNISSNHCPHPALRRNRTKAFHWENQRGLPVHLKFGLWFGNKVDLALTLDFAVETNSTMLNALKIASSLDSKYSFNYSTSSLNVFIYSVSGVQNDPESDKFWFLYKLNTKSPPELFTDSLSSLIPNDKESYVMWYRTSPWSHDVKVAPIEEQMLTEHFKFVS